MRAIDIVRRNQHRYAEAEARARARQQVMSGFEPASGRVGYPEVVPIEP